MTTGYVFAPPLQGHINPMLPIVEELVKRGHHLVFYSQNTFCPVIEATDAEYRPYPVDTILLTQKELQIKQKYVWLLIFMKKLLFFAEQQIPALLKEVKKSRPDYIFYDSMTPWGKILAQITGLPHICSCAFYYIGMENYKTTVPKLEIVRDIFHHFPILLKNRIPFLTVRYRLQKCWKVKIPYLIGFFGNKGDRTLIYSSRLFQEGAEHFDKTFKFIGHPVKNEIAEPKIPVKVKPDIPFIFISLGTVFNDKPDFFSLCIEAFENTTYQVLLIWDAPSEFFDALPVNIHVVKWLDYSMHCCSAETSLSFYYP